LFGYAQTLFLTSFDRFTGPLRFVVGFAFNDDLAGFLVFLLFLASIAPAWFRFNPNKAKAKTSHTLADLRGVFAFDLVLWPLDGKHTEFLFSEVTSKIHLRIKHAAGTTAP
jgi:hypothetical protein